MAKLNKRTRTWLDKIDFNQRYPVDEGLAIIKDCATAKFSESVDVSIRLGIDPRNSDQVVRGSSILPHGIGKVVRVAVFAQGDGADAAKAAGADAVGMEDLAKAMQAGDIDYGVVIAAPDAMRVVGQLGPMLGPRGLMPNPKSGTVTPDVATAVGHAKAGQVRFRADRSGNIHSTIGRADFTVVALKENLQCLVEDLKKLKPASSKGVYFRKIAISSTMGPGLMVDHLPLV